MTQKTQNRNRTDHWGPLKLQQIVNKGREMYAQVIWARHLNQITMTMFYSHLWHGLYIHIFSFCQSIISDDCLCDQITMTMFYSQLWHGSYIHIFSICQSIISDNCLCDHPWRIAYHHIRGNIEQCFEKNCDWMNPGYRRTVSLEYFITWSSPLIINLGYSSRTKYTFNKNSRPKTLFTGFQKLSGRKESWYYN
jgi:hypothetical protein